MPTYRFGEWTPDQAAYQNPGVTVAENVFPSATGYLPVPALTSSTNALDDYPRGAIQVRDAQLNVYQYAGDEAKLYQNVDNVWTDKSKVGGYATASGEAWEFVTWENTVIATNFTDAIQTIDIGGSAFADLTTDFKCRNLAVVRDFVVAGNTIDATDDEVPSRVRWSAFADPTDWTVSTSTLSGYQDLKAGIVRRIFGGEFGVVMQNNSVWRMTFVGAPNAFQFDEVLPGIGLIASGAAARDGDTIYFLSDRGFFSITNGTQTVPIGAEKVDRYVLADIDLDYAHRISCVADPKSQKVFWAYPGQGNSGGRPNKILCFDRTNNRWTSISEDVELLWQSGGTGTTLDGLGSQDLDALSVSLDSRRWIGGANFLGAFNPDYKSGFFDGENTEAVIETAEYELHGGSMAMLNAFRPMIDGGSVTAQVGYRNRQTDPVVWSDVLTQSSSGRFTTRANAKFHRFRFILSGDWTHAVGFQLDPTEAKRGGKRG